MATPNTIAVEAPGPDSIEPFGWLLGTPLSQKENPICYRSPASDFWHEHLFDAGTQGETEVLWVNYRDNGPLVSKLEVHHMTQQAVVPLTKEIVQILCLSDAVGVPDLSTLRAFHLSPGTGICMRPGVWHATRADDATCLMLTRRSTTEDLIDHLVNERPAKESAIRTIPEVRLVSRGTE
jgi:ureidoglycolate lyase